jgi:membrane associated rhomboid family serine protease
MHPAKYVIAFGVILMLVGFIWYFFGDKLSWLGNLPGDIRVERPGFKMYFPITTMLLLSALISLFSWIIRRFC